MGWMNIGFVLFLSFTTTLAQGYNYPAPQSLFEGESTQQPFPLAPTPNEFSTPINGGYPSGAPRGPSNGYDRPGATTPVPNVAPSNNGQTGGYRGRPSSIPQESSNNVYPAPAGGLNPQGPSSGYPRPTTPSFTATGQTSDARYSSSDSARNPSENEYPTDQSNYGQSGSDTQLGFYQGQGRPQNGFGGDSGDGRFSGGSDNGLSAAEEGDYSAIPGQPDTDYPILSSAPETSFSCDQQQYPGYYADVETRCQVFHVCANNKTFDFLCPNGTIFHQEYLVCVWWNQFDCTSAPSFYGVNANLYDYSITGAQQQTGAIPASGYPTQTEGGQHQPEVTRDEQGGLPGSNGYQEQYPTNNGAFQPSAAAAPISAPGYNEGYPGEGSTGGSQGYPTSSRPSSQIPKTQQPQRPSTSPQVPHYQSPSGPQQGQDLDTKDTQYPGYRNTNGLQGGAGRGPQYLPPNQQTNGKIRNGVSTQDQNGNQPQGPSVFQGNRQATTENPGYQQQNLGGYSKGPSSGNQREYQRNQQQNSGYPGGSPQNPVFQRQPQKNGGVPVDTPGTQNGRYDDNAQSISQQRKGGYSNNRRNHVNQSGQNGGPQQTSAQPQNEASYGSGASAEISGTQTGGYDGNAQSIRPQPQSGTQNGGYEQLTGRQRNGDNLNNVNQPGYQGGQHQTSAQPQRNEGYGSGASAGFSGTQTGGYDGNAQSISPQPQSGTQNGGFEQSTGRQRNGGNRNNVNQPGYQGGQQQTSAQPQRNEGYGSGASAGYPGTQTGGYDDNAQSIGPQPQSGTQNGGYEQSTGRQRNGGNRNNVNQPGYQGGQQQISAQPRRNEGYGRGASAGFPGTETRGYDDNAQSIGSQPQSGTQNRGYEQSTGRQRNGNNRSSPVNQQGYQGSQHQTSGQPQKNEGYGSGFPETQNGGYNNNAQSISQQPQSSSGQQHGQSDGNVSSKPNSGPIENQNRVYPEAQQPTEAGYSNEQSSNQYTTGQQDGGHQETTSDGNYPSENKQPGAGYPSGGPSAGFSGENNSDFGKRNQNGLQIQQNISQGQGSSGGAGRPVQQPNKGYLPPLRN